MPQHRATSASTVCRNGTATDTEDSKQKRVVGYLEVFSAKLQQIGLLRHHQQHSMICRNVKQATLLSTSVELCKGHYKEKEVAAIEVFA